MNRERIAALMWKTQVVDAGAHKSVAARRTPEAFSDAGKDTRNPWLKQADAIIAALPDMIAPLVWEKGVVDWARLKQGGRYVACSTTPHGSWSWWLDGDDESLEVCSNEDAAKARANTHHRAAIMAAFKGADK